MPFYQYVPCEGSAGEIFTSNVNPSTSLVGQTISFPNLIVNGNPLSGQCYHIGQVSPLPGYIPDVTIDWDTVAYITYPTCEDCVEANNYEYECNCSTVTNTTGGEETWRYVDCNGNLVSDLTLLPGETSPKLCVRQWLNLAGDIQFYGECINGECPSFYLLTDCSDEENTFCSNSVSLALYADNDIAVTLYGEAYAGKCWTVTTIDECESPLDVTVNQNFPAGCLPCLNQFVTNYELVNCEDDSVIYTSTDLSQHVDQVVQLEVYGNACWFVKTLNSNIPSDTPVIVSESFNDCPECTSKYYLLEDCNPLATTEPIVTITDLSVFVGEVITLDSCPEICWTVSETTYSSDYQVVNIENNFSDCAECTENLKCYCVSFTNTTGVIVSVEYIDCLGERSKLEVASGETSEKQCFTYWTTRSGITITNHGLCVDGICPPDPPKPKRKVTPGYDTPACSTEYYEKVVCNYSEWMYKDVLQKRYGISNCCPEELLKWQIKYEMLMLDVLINPNYECTPTSSCCEPGITLNYTTNCNS